MSYEAYNAFATAVKEEMKSLSYEEQLGILTIVVNAMNSRKKAESVISNEEKLSLFEKFKGSMKVGDDFNAKKELMDALDKRYGV